MMDLLHLGIATLPLLAYVGLIGLLHLLRRPFVTTGARDMAALGIGLSGLMVAGPMELFFPSNAAIWAGVFVWPLLLAFYGLCVTLLVLVTRPRLVIYNTNREQLRPLLADLANKIDPQSRWSGDNLCIPSINVQTQIESTPMLSTVQLVSSGSQQNLEGWQQLEYELRHATGQVRSGPAPVGMAMLAGSILLSALLIVWLTVERHQVQASLQEMLRL